MCSNNGFPISENLGRGCKLPSLALPLHINWMSKSILEQQKRSEYRWKVVVISCPEIVAANFASSALVTPGNCHDPETL